MKICKKCGVDKEDSNFWRYRNGLQAYCKPCVAASKREHYARNKTGEKGPQQLRIEKNLELLQQGLKFCKQCENVKPISGFNKNASRKDGAGDECRECTHRIKSASWKNNPEPKRATNRKCLYGITDEQYKQMLKNQGEGCAICGGNFRLSVDHNHDTDKIRGILCLHCNTGIGSLKHDFSTLIRAADYIRRTS